MQYEINSYIDKMKNIQQLLLNYIDEDENCMEENFNNLIQSLSDVNIPTDKYHLRSFLYLIIIISNNHFRSKNFISKFEKILKYLKNPINEHFKESELFDLFLKNKRILLFLIQEKMITINHNYATKIMNEDQKNCLYFYNEIKNYVKLDNYDNDPEIKSSDYLSKRLNGSNNDEICKLIQNDNLEEFISYIQKSNTSYDATIEQSIYETNYLLIGKNPTLIDYAAFYGSIQILQYLLKNNVKTTPNLWLYAIHSNNLSVIHLFEENEIDLDQQLAKLLFKLSIKCHHIELANYFLLKFFNCDEYYQFNTIQKNFVDYSFHYYNYIFFPAKVDIHSIDTALIKYDHFDIFEIMCKNELIDIPKLINIAEIHNKTEFIKFLLSHSIEVSITKPFSVWERCQDGQLKLTDIAENLFANSNFPCFILFFGSTKSGKSTIASVLFGGPNVDISNSNNLIFEVSDSWEPCTKGINAVGPIKCKDFVSAFDLALDDMSNENLNRDIFFIDTEGLSSVEGEVEWLKQAICSMIPYINVSFYVGQSINKDNLDKFIKYASLIQTFERMNIFHGYGYINNRQNNYKKNILIQNDNLTNELINLLSSNFDDINNSHYKCFSVLSFEVYENEFKRSLIEVAHFIVDICLHDGFQINGKLLVNIVQRYANEIDDIDSNLTDQKIIDKMKNTFFESVNKEIMGQLEKQNEYIKKFVSERICIGFFKYDDIKLDTKDIDTINRIVNNTIQTICPNLADPSLKESAISFAKNMTKKAYEKEIDEYKIKQDELYIMVAKLSKKQDALEDDVKTILKNMNKRHKISIPFDGNSTNQFNGIFTKLGNGKAINAFENGIIEIKCSSLINTNDNSCQPEYILIFGNDKKYFQSKDEPNSWIAINFKNYIVKMTHYTVMWNGNSEKSNMYPLKWKIEGSDDFQNWEFLDFQIIEDDFDCEESNTFEIENTKKNYYQYIRILQNGKNSINNNCLILTSLELFGDLRY